MVDFRQIMEALQETNKQRGTMIEQMQGVINQPPPATGGANEQFMQQLFAPPADMEEEELIIRDWNDFTTQFKSNQQLRDMIFAFGAALAQGGDDPLGNLSKGLIAMKGIQEKYKGENKEKALQDRQLKIQQGQAMLQGRQMDRQEATAAQDRQLKALELGIKGIEADSQSAMQIASLMFQNENLQLNREAGARAAATSAREEKEGAKRLEILDLQLQKAQLEADRAGFFEIGAGENPTSVYMKSMANSILDNSATFGIEMKPHEALSIAMGAAASNPTLKSLTSSGSADNITKNNIFNKHYQGILESIKLRADPLAENPLTPEQIQEETKKAVSEAIRLTEEELFGGSSTETPLTPELLEKAKSLGWDEKSVQIIDMNGTKVLKGTKDGQTKYARIKG